MSVSGGSTHKITAPALRRLKAQGKKITALTAYDVITSRLLDAAGVDLILVGDSVGMVFAGLESTIPVTVDEIIYHTKVVSRGCKRALLVADMPFMSYQTSITDAVHNAGRIVKEGGAEAIKIEGGMHMLKTIEQLVAIGIPVVGHLGLTPQSIHQFGGYSLRAKEHREAAGIREAAIAMDEAGISAIVLEKIPSDLATDITKSIAAPTIGIGAGSNCDGQILVSEDMLGIFDEFKPKFVRRFANLASDMREAFAAYVTAVEKGDFPNKDESY
jgi:3-methyl-2-oxobutanoate hydroxymethyltransferase